MMRISLLCLCLCTVAWASGCCHSYYSRNPACDTAYNSECDQQYDSDQPRKHGRSRRCKGDKRSRGSRQDCYDGSLGDCCCDQCCDGSYAGHPMSGSMPVDGSSMMMPGPGCAGGNCAQGTMS